MVAKGLTALYGTVCYGVFFVTFLYAIGFVENLVVPKSIDSGTDGPLAHALFVDALLLGVFAVQHSVMARPWFKRVWTKLILRPIERSTFVLFASLALVLVFWQWRPIGGAVWDVRSPTARLVLYAVSFGGWFTVLVSTFLINHFDLFGLRQVFLYAAGSEYSPLPFRTPALYKYLRHPIYLGFVLAFWPTPRMTVGHLVFAVATTAYILPAIQFEEHDLTTFYGETYRNYRERVPMLVPALRGRGNGSEASAGPRSSPPSSP